MIQRDVYLCEKKTHSRFLEASRLWLEPEAAVVVVGGAAAVRNIIHHTSLRNTIHMLCLTIDNLKHLNSSVDTWFSRGALEEGNTHIHFATAGH